MNAILGAVGIALLAAGGDKDPATSPQPAATEPPLSLTPRVSTPAAPTTPADDDVLVWRWKNGLRFGTADGRFQFKFGGRILWDNSWIQNKDMLSAAGLETQDGSEFRAARFFVSGDVYDDWFFKAQYDFAGKGSGGDKRPVVKDVYIGRRNVVGNATLRGGHFKEPFSIEELTSNRFITFMERALPNAFVPSRKNGVQLDGTAFDENLGWAVGVFRGGSDDAGHDAEDGAYSYTARVYGTPIYEDGGRDLLHLGVAFSNSNNEGASFAARPEIHNTNDWLDTGPIAAWGVNLGQAEVAGVFGPLHGTAEYVAAKVDGSGDPMFSGYYGTVGFFLTGESRGYDHGEGAWGRTVPNHPLTDQGGIGAIEAALRYSNLDLEDSGVNGGKAHDISVGLNWYPNANTRVMLDYVLADIKTTAVDGKDNILGLRFQFDW